MQDQSKKCNRVDSLFFHASSIFAFRSCSPRVFRAARPKTQHTHARTDKDKDKDKGEERPSERQRETETETDKDKAKETEIGNWHRFLITTLKKQLDCAKNDE